MVRTILFSFYDTLLADKERDKHHPTIIGDHHYAIFWRNLVTSIFFIEELVFSYGSSYKTDNKNDTPKQSNADKTFLLEYANSFLDDDSNGQIYAEIVKGLFYSSKKKWHDSRLLDCIFEIIEHIWYIKGKRRSSKVRKGATKESYRIFEDSVLDCLEECSPSEANEKIQILLMKKPIIEEKKYTNKKKERHLFTFVKTIISLLCTRITIEADKSLLMYYCKMLKDLGECLVYISENWVTQNTELIQDVQRRLSKAVAYIIYFCHREIRSTKGDTQKFLAQTLDGIMATIFVIVLKKKSKLHEHEETDTNTATVVTIVLNEYFEKPHDKTLFFDRKHIEVFQSKNYGGISNFLASDQLHDFFEESKNFKQIKNEY